MIDNAQLSEGLDLADLTLDRLYKFVMSGKRPRPKTVGKMFEHLLRGLARIRVATAREPEPAPTARWFPDEELPADPEECCRFIDAKLLEVTLNLREALSPAEFAKYRRRLFVLRDAVNVVESATRQA